MSGVRNIQMHSHHDRKFLGRLMPAVADQVKWAETPRLNQITQNPYQLPDPVPEDPN